MKTALKFVPGVLAAVAGFFSLALMDFLTIESIWLKLVLFLLVYVVAAVAVDKAMTAYGRGA